MLILTRFPDESVQIGDDITVLVVAVRGNKVRLGFDCPIDIPVHRTEVATAIARESTAYANELARDPCTNTRPPESLTTAVKAVCEEMRNSMAFLVKQGGGVQLSQAEQYRRIRDRLTAAMLADGSESTARNGGPQG